MLQIDETSFKLTAVAVYKMNDSLHERFTDWEGVYDWMRWVANEHSDKDTTFLSTGGFVLTFFTGPDIDKHCRASVSGYTAHNYISGEDVYAT